MQKNGVATAERQSDDVGWEGSEGKKTVRNECRPAGRQAAGDQASKLANESDVPIRRRHDRSSTVEDRITAFLAIHTNPLLFLLSQKYHSETVISTIK